MTTLADILGGEGAAGSPGQLRNVASKLDEVSDTAAHIQSGLSRLDAGSWTGEAANRYREKQNAELPPELGKLQGSFHLASRYVAIYAGDLERIQDEGRALARKREAAAAALQTAQNKESTARHGVTQAKAARIRAADPASAAHADTAVANANRAASAATAARARAAGSVSQIDADAAALRARLRACADRCSQGLVDASHQGIRNTLFSNIEHFKDSNPFGQVVIAPIFNFVASSIKLGDAALQYVGDGSSENLDKLAEAWVSWVDAAKPILEAISFAVLVAVAVIVIVGTGGGGAAAALPLLFTASRALWAIDTGLDATKAGADMYLVNRGKRSSSVLVEDTVNLGFDLISFGSVEKAVPSAWTYARTSTPQAQGWVTKQLATSKPGEELLISSTTDLVKKSTSLVLDHAVWPQVEATLSPSSTGGPVQGPGTTLTQNGNSQIRLTVAAPTPTTPLTVSTAP